MNTIDEMWASRNANTGRGSVAPTPSKPRNCRAVPGVVMMFAMLGTAVAGPPVTIPDSAYFAIYFNSSNEAVHAETLTRCPGEDSVDGSCPTAEVLIDPDRELVLDWSTSAKCAALTPRSTDIDKGDYEQLFRGTPWMPKDAAYAIYYNQGGDRVVIRGSTTSTLVAECVRKNNGQPHRAMVAPLDACRNDAAGDCPGQPCSPGYCAYWYNGVQYCKRC